VNRGSIPRRALVVGIALAASAALLHSQLSSALVSRGDDLTYRGEDRRAMDLYSRALALDPKNTVAIDRYAFSALTMHDTSGERRAIALASAVLEREPYNVTIRYDRALCNQALHLRAAAAADFEAIGRHERDARALLFAALDFQRTDLSRARTLARLAVAIEPSFAPARRDLARMGK
jgi:tetratricopeptide (TPR) repeat protein